MKHPAWYYEVFSSVFSFQRDYEYEGRVINLLAPIEGRIVEEIGAGTGEHARELVKYRPSRLLLVDSDPAAAAQLRQRFRQRFVTVETADGFAKRPGPFADVIVCLYSILQLGVESEGVASRFDSLVQRLSPGGSVVFEFIDTQVSRSVYPEGKVTEIIHSGNDELRIWTTYGERTMTIHYQGRVGRHAIAYAPRFASITRSFVEGVVRRNSELTLTAITALDSAGRRLIACASRGS